MNLISRVVENIRDSYSNEMVNTTVIVTVLVAVLILSLYEFMIYRVISHRAFYNRSFNICIAVIPFFISTIILSLQSNIVITLGTIGALAIIRFRTAVKDPVDMVYILWAIHIGITCGCQLYEVAVLTSLAVTIFLLILNHVSFGKKAYVLVFHCDVEAEEKIIDAIKMEVKNSRVKSRNYTAKGMDYVVEFSTKNPQIVSCKLRDLKVEKFSIIEYDSEDVI